MTSLLGHPRLVRLSFVGTPDEIWGGIARHGKPIQYAHIDRPLMMWDAWTRVAALPVSFEPPSASFVIDWAFLKELQARGVGFATLTLAAGISSTGDPALDVRLPFDEAYHLPRTTVQAISRTRAEGGCVIALGTTTTCALEHAALDGGALRPGVGLATQRIGAQTRLRVVDAIVSGAHEPGESHYQLLRAFANDAMLQRMSRALKQDGYRSHEFGDSVLIMRQQGESSLSSKRLQQHQRQLRLSQHIRNKIYEPIARGRINHGFNAIKTRISKVREGRVHSSPFSSGIKQCL